MSPHPRTQGSSYLTVEHGRKALRKVGAPEDLLQCIKETSKEKTVELMKDCDFAIATGGAALVKVVYAAGKPSHTVGAGNVVSIVDDTVDIPSTAAKIVKSKTANNSASCSSENAVAIEADRPNSNAIEAARYLVNALIPNSFPVLVRQNTLALLRLEQLLAERWSERRQEFVKAL